MREKKILSRRKSVHYSSTDNLWRMGSSHWVRGGCSVSDLGQFLNRSDLERPVSERTRKCTGSDTQSRSATSRAILHTFLLRIVPRRVCLTAHSERPNSSGPFLPAGPPHDIPEITPLDKILRAWVQSWAQSGKITTFAECERLNCTLPCVRR